MDLRDTVGGPVLDGGERGLLGIAFHPQFAANRKLYLYFTRVPDGDNVVAEYLAAPGGDTADPTSRRDLLVIDDLYSNHNAGWIAFGNDGLLYVPTGDGGMGGDPLENGQDDRELLGKVLRIDVDRRTGSKPYGIPAGNPFANSADGPNDPRPEMWHKGLRNPFRFGFDRATGDIYLGDVGQGAWEEVDYSPNVAGVNWGWDDREGRHCFEPRDGCLTAGRIDPISEHSQNDGWRSVIGGQVYRGSCFPDLAGEYFYGDYYAQELWGLRVVGGQAQDDRLRLDNVGAITGIHADGFGELYVVTHDGRVRRIVVP
jgi:glucose/arabinose dehydrogenase